MTALESLSIIKAAHLSSAGSNVDVQQLASPVEFPGCKHRAQRSSSSSRSRSSAALHVADRLREPLLLTIR